MSLSLYATGSDTSSVYVLPPATTSSLGGVIVGTGLNVTATGILSAPVYSNVSVDVTGAVRSGDVVGKITIDGTTTTLYCNKDTHYTSHLFLGAVGGNANASEDTTNPYLLCVDNTTNRNSVQLKSGGNITISGKSGVATFTVPTASTSTVGCTKVYTASGQNTDGTMTQKAITDHVTTSINNIGKIVTYVTGSTTPTSGTIGQIWINSTAGKVYIYDGGNWQLVNSWQ